MNKSSEIKNNISEKINKLKNVATADKKGVKLKPLIFFLSGFLFVSALFTIILIFKANTTFNIVSQRITSFLSVNLANLPPADPKERERLDVLILGIRGENDPYGGQLTDTIILASINTKSHKTALISIPRDTYIKLPIVNTSAKLNEAYEVGEHKQPNGGGIALAKLAVEKIAGVNIDYAIVIDFLAFKETVDLLGGIDVNAAKPLHENLQWGGKEFVVEHGINHMDGDTALFYVRSRFTTSDFDRARRQQEVILAIKQKATSLGFISSPQKLFGVLDILGRHVKTDLTASEISKLYSIGQKIDSFNVRLKIIDTSEDLLIPSYNDAGAYILLPAGNDFSQIHDVVRNILN